MGRLKDITKKYERERQQIGEDFMNEKLNQWEASQQQVRDSLRRIDNNAKRRQEALQILERLENKYIAKENKKRLFDNLNLLYDKNILSPWFFDKIVKFLGITYREGIISAEKALKEFHNSVTEYGDLNNLKNFWFEIFYLIEEGIPFTDDNFAYINSIIKNEIGLDFFERDKEMETLEGFLKRSYSSFNEPPFWGTQFYVDFNERRVKEKIEYLRSTLFFPEDEDGYRGPVPDYLKGITFDILSNFVKEENSEMDNSSSAKYDLEDDLDSEDNEEDEVDKLQEDKENDNEEEETEEEDKDDTMDDEHEKTKESVNKNLKLSPEDRKRKSKILIGSLATLCLIFIISFVVLLSIDDSDAKSSIEDVEEATSSTINDNLSNMQRDIENQLAEIEANLQNQENIVPESMETSENKAFSEGKLPSSGSINQFAWLAQNELTSQDLSEYSKSDLRLLRNAIYALHGYKFQSADLSEYFNRFSGYNPSTSNVTDFNAMEQANINLIKSME